MINKKLIILLTLVILLLTFSGVSAADSNDMAINSDKNLLSSDDITTETDKIDVKLVANEQIGIYGNKDTKLKVYASDKDGNNITGGSVLFVDVFGQNYTADMINGTAKTEVYVGETGKFNISCMYIGTDVYRNANATLPLTIPIADTSCTNIVATRYDDTVYFTGNVKSDYRTYPDYDDYEEVTRGIVTVYVDGASIKASSSGEFSDIHTTPYFIGSNMRMTNGAWAPENMFTGWMDDYVLYKKGFTAAEVKALYDLYK